MGILDQFFEELIVRKPLPRHTYGFVNQGRIKLLTGFDAACLGIQFRKAHRQTLHYQ